MESMNVDDVSASFSNLGVTTTIENSQLTSQGLALPSTSLGQERHPVTFLSLPELPKWHIYMHLHSRDCIALSSTCREMYNFNTLTYRHLQFLPPNSLYSIACFVHRLAERLVCSPHYAQAVRTLRIVGWNATNIPEGCTHEMVYKCLDEGVTAILENAPHIHWLTLDFELTKAIHYFPKTFATLARVRTIRTLRLSTFLALTHMAENNPLLEYNPDEAPPAYEQVSLRVCNGGWLPIMMRDPRNLRWFGFTVLVEPQIPGDTNWATTLHRVTEAATELETLVLENAEGFDAVALGLMLQSGFDRGVLGKLRSFSVNTNALSLSSLTQLFYGFSRSSVTHLRIVVNYYGLWLRDIGPQYLSELAKFVPDLEEISLDQYGMIKAMPLPGDLSAWGEGFRAFKKLRRIVFASMFVVDLCRPIPVDDDEGDYEEEEEEEGAEVGEDQVMDVDGGGGGDEGYETEEVKIDGAPVVLAVWADKFLDDHLRMLLPFSEIWFIDHRFPGRTAAGFNQRVMEGEGGRAEHIIHYPLLKRDGWWWDEHDPMPLD